MKNFKVVPSRLSVRLSVALAIANLSSPLALAQTSNSPNLQASNVSGDKLQQSNVQEKKPNQLEKIIVTASRIQASLN